MTPTMVRMTLSTVAKIGRSMKKWEKRMKPYRGRPPV
jgi:hypothetical protein